MKTEAIETMLSNLECRLHSWERKDGFFEHGKIQEARAELAVLKEAEKALVGLTPGGSEYVDDPVRCVAFVRCKEEGLSKAMKRFKDRADKVIGKCLEIVRGQTTVNIAEVDLLRRIEIDIERLEGKE